MSPRTSTHSSSVASDLAPMQHPPLARRPSDAPPLEYDWSTPSSVSMAAGAGLSDAHAAWVPTYATGPQSAAIRQTWDPAQAYSAPNPATALTYSAPNPVPALTYSAPNPVPALTYSGPNPAPALTYAPIQYPTWQQQAMPPMAHSWPHSGSAMAASSPDTFGSMKTQGPTQQQWSVGMVQDEYRRQTDLGRYLNPVHAGHMPGMM